MKFFIKEVVGALLSPLALCLLLVIAGAIALRVKLRRVAIISFLGAFLVGYGGALLPVGNAFLKPLESQYPPLSDPETTRARAIVVLGSAYFPQAHVPVTGAIQDGGIARIAEGVRLARRLPMATLVVSGGAPPGYYPSAEGYARFARELGIAPDRLVILDQPRDTNAESLEVARLLGSEQFLLVTSASHMPRAMRLMLRAGLHPIPSPTDQQTGVEAQGGWRSLLPSSSGLRRTERALHEYLGLAAIWVHFE